MRSPRLVVGGAVLAASAVIAAGSAPADTVSSWQYPSSIGSGYAIADGDTFQAKVSASGRWVAFESVATNLVPGAPLRGVYLRDRWSDVTTLVHAVDPDRSVRNLTISTDGNFVAGSDVGPSDPTRPASWVHDHRAGTTTAMPTDPKGRTLFVLGVNNDGYLIAAPKAAFAHSGFTTAWLVSGASISWRSETVASDRILADLTPSLQYGLSITDPIQPAMVTRFDMTDGSYVEAPLNAGSNPAQAAISPNGRWVAHVQARPGDVYPSWRLWDTQTGTVLSRPGESAFGPVHLHAVLDDGRIIADLATSQVLLDLVGGGAPRLIDRVELTNNVERVDDLNALRSEVATDINRVVICSNRALSPADTNIGVRDCYLRPFPPSPLAAG